MDLAVRIGGDDLVHEAEELDAPAPLLVGHGHLAGGDVEGGGTGSRCVALVIVAVAGQRPAVGQLQIALGTLQRLNRGLLVDADDKGVLRWRHVQPDHIGALAANSGSLLSHQDLRPRRSILWLRRKRHTSCSCTSPQRRRNQPSHPAREAGRGARSSTARMRRPLCSSYLRFGPGDADPLARSAPRRQIAGAHVLTVRGIVLTRVRSNGSIVPPAAIRTIRARRTSPCGVFGARSRASSTARSSSSSRTSTASGIIPILNHESGFWKVGTRSP